MNSFNESNANKNQFRQVIGNCVEALDQVEDSLDDRDKVSLQTSSKEISEEDILDNTVDEIKILIQKQNLPKNELKKALEIEEKGKDRKTAKQIIKKDLKRKKSSNLKKEIINDARELRKLLADLETYDGHQENPNSEKELKTIDEEEEAEITRKTERVLKNLKRGNLSAEEIEKVREALEDYNQDDFASMNQKIEKIELSNKSILGDSNTEEEINKMENMLRDLEKKEKKIEEDQLRGLDDLRFEANEIGTKKRKKNRIKDQQKEELNPKNLNKSSNIEPKNPKSAKGSVDEIEDIFTKIDDSKVRFQSQDEKDGDIDDNIQELERIVN